MIVKIKKLTEDAIIPCRGSEHAAGYDFYTTEEYELKPMEIKAFKTGISMEMPDDIYGDIEPRSGLALRSGIAIMGGKCDPDYRGEVMIMLINLKSESLMIKKYDKIAQIIFKKFETPVLVESDELNVTQRGTGGFGSTDKINRQNNDLGVSLDDINKEILDINKEFKLNE